MAVRLKKSSEYSWRSTFITSVEGRRPENKEKTGWETEETEVISGGAAVIRLFCSHHLSPTCSCVTKEPADYATALSVCVCVCVFSVAPPTLSARLCVFVRECNT